jgi:hypothetical protein
MDATTATQSRQLGSLLVEKRLITAEQLEQALQQQESTGAWLGEVVVAEFGVSQVDLLQLLAEHMHDPVRARAAEPESPGRADFRLRRPIGEIFVELGFITSDQLQSALAVQESTGARIGEILVEQGFLTRLDLASALAEHWESGEPASAVAGQPLRNGAPVAQPSSLTRELDDHVPLTELETRPAGAEEQLGSARVGRHAWRRRKNSSTAEDGHSQARTDEGAAQLAALGSLDIKIASLGGLLDSFESLRVSDALATGARLAAAEAKIDLLAGMETRVRESVERDLADRPEVVAPRLDHLENGLEELVALERRLAAVAATTVEVGAALDARQEESAAQRERVGEAQKVAAGAERATAILRAEMASLGARIDELQSLRHADVQTVRGTNKVLEERLDALSVSREGDADAARNAARAFEEAQALREELLGGLNRVEASLGQRLELIEDSLASDDWSKLSATVAELGRRLDEQVAIGEEQARASERAIRKGLASLGKRLTGPESKYAGAGKGLRRSIERLGAAVVEANARMADQLPVSEAEGCVAFAPTAVGYQLVELPGGPPEIGSTVEVEGCEGALVVTRYGRSPLPFDRRPCAYLGRA